MPVIGAAVRGLARAVAGETSGGMQLRSRVKKEVAEVAVAPPARTRRTKRAAVKEEAAEVKAEVAVASPLRPRRRIKQEATSMDAAVSIDHDGEVVVKKETASPRKKKAKQRAVRAEPLKWREQLKGIGEMRAKKDAEVDAYGCEVWSRLAAAGARWSSLTTAWMLLTGVLRPGAVPGAHCALPRADRRHAEQPDEGPGQRCRDGSPH